MNTPPGAGIKAKPTGERFVLVDALRGIAAFAVLCHHLLHNSSLERPLWKILPGWFAEFCHFGAFGVQIFFVLSGFVIAHSLRNVSLTSGGLGNFFLRRQLRLDPPYWTVLLITILMLFVEMRMPWIDRKPIPGIADVVKNMLYLQTITKGMAIVGVAWTLCLEVQFYLVFILLLLAGKWAGGPKVKAENVSLLLVASLGLVSITLSKEQWTVWFLQWWFYFAAGVICYWGVRDRKQRFAFPVFMALSAIGLYTKDPLPLLVGAATAILLYTAGTRGGLTTWLNFRVLQYLGKISYSLYLIHLTVAVYILRFGFRMTQEDPTWALLWFTLAMGVSIAAGHLFFVFVERPSMRFASRFKTAQAVEVNKPSPSTVTLLQHCATAAAK